MTSAPSPKWKQLFDVVDQRLSPTLNEFAQRDEVAALAALALRGRAEITSAFERMSRRNLHALNLPAGSDVTRLLEHIARVEREVSSLRHLLADRENADYLAGLEATRAKNVAPPPQKKPAPTRKKAS